MTRPGPAPKPADSRQRRNQASPRLVVLPNRPFEAPEAPRGFLKSTADLWDAYWRSDVSKVALPVDLGMIEIYFRTLDEWQRCGAVTSKMPVVSGSRGQPRLNPLTDRADRLAGLLPRLAAEIGLSPLARSKLAIEVGMAAKTIEDLARGAGQGVDDEDDPRFALLELE